MRSSSLKTRSAFTIIEILVVVTIIVALIAILVPAMGHFRKQGDKAAAYSLLGNIRDGLASYYADFNMYPPSAPDTNLGDRGSAMVAEALVGYLPGAVDGAGTGNPTNDSSDLGFRIKKINPAMGGASGKIYGPYASTDPKVFAGAPFKAFIDPWGHEILYFRSTKSQSPATLSSAKKLFGSGALSDDTATYFFSDNDCITVPGASTKPSALTSPPAPALFYNLLGSSTNNVSGPVVGSTSYILISAGPDETYFTADDIVMTK